MKKRVLAFVLAAVMAFTAFPAVNVSAAGCDVYTTAKAAKSAKLKITKVAADVDKAEYYGLKYTWSKVSGAKYQYRFKTADSAEYSKIKATKKNSASAQFMSYENITFQVRSVKTVNGQKKVGAWTTKKLKAAKIDSILSKAMNLQDGYLKNGLVYQGGLYASDKNHSDCDLDIALFNYGKVDHEMCYIIKQNGKVVTYGYFETESKKLSDGTEYTAIKAPVDGKADTYDYYGYVFTDVEGGSGYVITKDGKKVVAKEIDVTVAWEIQKEAY